MLPETTPSKAMLPLMTVLERGGKFVQCVKYACELDGLPAGPVRQPQMPLRGAALQHGLDIVRELGLAQAYGFATAGTLAAAE